MQITSSEFSTGELVPMKYTCEGPNISPPLTFIGVPENAKSLVLMVEDPDAPAKPWVHWLVFNIPPTSIGFSEGSIAEGATEGLCNGNTFGYEGPCPPENEHQYLFKLYALDKVLDIPDESDRKVVLKEMEGHVITEAVLSASYKKQSKTVSQA